MACEGMNVYRVLGIKQCHDGFVATRVEETGLQKAPESSRMFQTAVTGGALNTKHCFGRVEGYHGRFMATRVKGVVRPPQKHLIEQGRVISKSIIRYTLPGLLWRYHGGFGNQSSGHTVYVRTKSGARQLLELLLLLLCYSQPRVE